MKVRDLFNIGLTVPEHENNDLHYIGEALPVPSLPPSVLSTGSPAFSGGSAIAAREDHVHAIDVEDLIQFINENSEEIDLSNYYTKAEVDALIAGIDPDLSNYYTKAEIDIFIGALADSIDLIEDDLSDLELDVIDVINDLDDNYYTKSEIDAIILALYDTEFFAIELYWSYGPFVNNTANEFTNRYIAFREFNITQLFASLTVADATNDIVCNLWHDSGSGFANVETITLQNTETSEISVLSSPLVIGVGDGLYFEIEDVGSTGTGEEFTIGLRGFYSA